MSRTRGFRCIPECDAGRPRRHATIGRRQRSALLAVLLVLATSFWCVSRGQTPGQTPRVLPSGEEISRAAADPYERDQLHDQAREAQEVYRLRVSLPLTVPEANPLNLHRPGSLQAPTSVAAEPDGVLWIGKFLLVAGLFMVWKLTPELAAAFGVASNQLMRSPAAKPNYTAKVLAEDAVFEKFLSAFRIGPISAASRAATGDRTLGTTTGANVAEADPLQQVLNTGPQQVRNLRKMLQEIGRDVAADARQELLNRLALGLQMFKENACLPELAPVWQMASALEYLLNQLNEKCDRATPSTLRTVGSALDLLEALCRPGLPTDLCTNPPIRLLAVDDEALSRHALAVALKKGVTPPDLAANGPAALALAAKESYDVIFLDVQMPGIDGFEVCSRIHQTDRNRTTPVVFVTLNSDFNARAKSTLSGGSDLIAKPFLTFEITVKALTFALRKRLQDRGQLALENPVPATPEPVHSSQRARLSLTPTPAVDLTIHFPRSSRPSADSPNTVFVKQTSTKLQALKKLAATLSGSTDWEVRQQALTDLFLQLHLVTATPGFKNLPTAVHLNAALAGLLKKLLESPKNSTPSAVLTVTTAVELLDDLCAKGIKTDLALTPPLRLLVVDDDPIARRVLRNGLQTAFNNPETAEDGEAALTLAGQHAYDVIFMDVEMPGMDGYTACSRLRKTAANRLTPVVFVTSHNDAKARKKSRRAGGSDFITKPFITSELTVKALTLALRHRLDAQRPETAARFAEVDDADDADEANVTPRRAAGNQKSLCPSDP